MFDGDAFTKAIKAKGLRMQTVAEIMQMDRSTLYQKVKGNREFTLGEIQRSRAFFDKAEMMSIFFAEKVS